MNFILNHILSVIIFVPLAFAVPTFFSKCARTNKILSLVGSTIAFLLSVLVWCKFDASSADLQFAEQYMWVPDFGIQYLVGVDGISLLLLMLTTFLTPLVLLSLPSKADGDSVPNTKMFPLLLMLEAGMLGSIVALDFVFFYVFWEAMLIPMYFMIGIWGGSRRLYATTKFVIYTVFGSLLMLVAAIVLYFMHFEAFGVYSTSILDLYKVDIDASNQMWLFAAFALAFAIKIPIWPFHTWLPDAHVEAPTAGSVILAGVLLKLGTYGFIRFAIPLFPEATYAFAPYLLSLGIIGIIYGAFTAWVQEDAKKLVAYSSVSHLGFVVIGMLAFKNGELSTIALTGSVYQMINHGISTGALFFLVGIIYAQKHTRLLKDYGGLAKVMPWFAIFFIVATLGSVGLPGTGGFVGEFLILIGLFQSSPIAAVCAATGVLFGAIYMLKLCKELLFGPITSDENLKLKDCSLTQFIYLTPLAVLIVVMGIAPNLFLNKVRSSLEYFSQNIYDYELTITPFAERSNSTSATEEDYE